MSFGSMSSCDPGGVHVTIYALVWDHVRVCAVAMSAVLHVQKNLSAKTAGSLVEMIFYGSIAICKTTALHLRRNTSSTSVQSEKVCSS